MLNLSCVICAELFKHSDDVYITVCGHMFHFVCLKQWMERSKSCPQCRNRCTDRNIFRVYFNLANVDVNNVDVCSLQEQLENANLQIKIKDNELQKAEQKMKELKESQKKCMKTISSLEVKLQKNEFITLSYAEQMKLLKTDVKVLDDLRKENRWLKDQIETMESASSILTATNAEAENLLKNENNPKKLCILVMTLKRELRNCETKKTDLRNLLKVVQNDNRKGMEMKKAQEERIAQLESDNYQLSEKIKELTETAAASTSLKMASRNIKADMSKSMLESLKSEQKRLTISPTIKDNIKKIEESNSPYLNIKSSSLGLVPLFKHKTDTRPRTDAVLTTTAKVATLKISPMKNANGASTSNSFNGSVRRVASDLGEKYSIFKKPRLGLIASSASAGAASLMKPLNPNYVSNGFGGLEKVDPFARNPDEEDEETNRKSATTTVSKTNTLSVVNRLKTGGLRNFKIGKDIKK